LVYNFTRHPRLHDCLLSLSECLDSVHERVDIQDAKIGRLARLETSTVLLCTRRVYFWIVTSELTHHLDSALTLGPSEGGSVGSTPDCRVVAVYMFGKQNDCEYDLYAMQYVMLLRQLRHLDDHLANVLCGLEVFIRLLELIKLENLVDDWPNSANFEGPVHVGELLLVACDGECVSRISLAGVRADVPTKLPRAFTELYNSVFAKSKKARL
jgi:hypothetical protein